MSSSWFNISGNLSSIASNVTSFTKEVLHDAAKNNSYEDNPSQPEYEQNSPNVDAYQSPDDPFGKIAHLQSELQTLSNENAYKNEQIYHLQTEHEETITQYNNHFENLKQNLLEKEKEIELFSQRYNEVSTRFYELESQLTQKDAFSMDTDWNDDWSGDNAMQDVDDLKFKNECLANDLAMKEIIINTVESKMLEISNSTIEASNFSDWMDGILQEKTISEDKFKQISSTLDDKTNIENQWKEICLMIDKYMIDHVSTGDKNYLDNVDEWISKLIDNNDALERDNKEYKDIISNIEISISKNSDGYDEFKIADFSEWFDSLGNNDINYIFYNDSSKTMLDQIQNEIRDFDDDDGDFQIADFSVWLEKVQCRIDDLEVEVINEQETRDAEEKQRILERETLNDLFIQKQNEISLLKVELYNKSSHTLNPIVEFEQEDLMTVHEQLNETTARCEALQHELATAQKQVIESGEKQDHLTVVTADYEHIKEQLSKTEQELTDFKEEHNLLSQEFSKVSEESEDWKSKYELLQSAEVSTTELEKQLDDMSANNTCMTEEIQNLQLSNENTQTELDEFKIKYDSVCAELDKVSKEHSELTNVNETLQHSETLSQDLQIQVNSLSDINDCIKEQLLTSESSKESIQAELSEMKIRYDSMSTQVDLLTSDLKEATNRYELLQAAETVSDSLQLQLNNLSADKDSLKEQILISESSKESMHIELNGWRTKYNSISVEFEELSSALNKMKAKCDILQDKESDLEALQTQFSEQSSQFDLCKEQLSILQSAKESMKIEFEELRTQYTCLHGEYNQLSKDHNDITNKYEATKLGENGISEELKRVSNELLEQNKMSKNLENELQDTKTEYNLLKLVQLQSEEHKEKLQCDYTALKEINEANEKIVADVVRIDADLTLMATLLTMMMNKTLQPSDLDVSIWSEKSVILFGCIKVLAEKYTAPCKQCIELNGVVDGYKSKHIEQESKMEDHKNVYNILVYVINSINNILPEDKKGNIIVNDTLCSTDLSTYALCIQSLEEFIRNIDEIKDYYIKLNNDHHQEVEKMENLLQMEKVVKDEYISKVDMLNVTVEDYKNIVENLKLQITEAEQKAEQSKQTVDDTGGGGRGGDSGGMKFGAIKRKLQELEDTNQSLTEENEELKKSNVSGGLANVTDEFKAVQRELSDKKQECECYMEECKVLKLSFLEMQEQITVADSAHDECKLLKEKLLEYENMIETASNVSDEASVASRQHQDQLHSLSLMLTEKNEEIEEYQEETNHLKSKLLEMENEISDLELIRGECKQLKAMLVGKEHQNKVDDTITMLQQESKQLKQIISEKDTEVQHMHNMILEKENELSNMELIREECKQLKQMLVTKGPEHPSPSLSNENAELKAKDAEIVELRNSNSDMELLREECRQLKQMLLNSSSSSLSINESTSKDTSENISYQLLEAMLEDRDIQIAQKDTVISELHSKILEMNLLKDESQQLKDTPVGNGSQEADITDSNSTVGPASSNAEFFESSFVQQVQQLEEFIKEKDEELRNKERELELLTAKHNEKEIIISDFHTIQSECKMLKGSLTEKEQVLIELQDDLDNANVALQQKNNDIKKKENSCMELEKGMEEAMNIINAKDSEIRRLNEEVSESMAQDETMHILQTEYRNVEERLRETESDLERSDGQLHKVKEVLNETESECERLKVYVEQHNELSISLKERDEELSIMKLQSTENSIMESDITRLHQHLDELNTLLYESEQKNDEYSKTLEQRNMELENLTYNCNHLKDDIVVIKNEYVERSEIEKENLQSEKETLLQLCSDKEENIRSLEGNVARLETDISRYINKTSTLKSQISVFEKTIKENDSVINEKVNQTKRLLGQLEQNKTEKGNLEVIINQHQVSMMAKEEKVYKLQTSLDDSLREISMKAIKISQLESELTASKEYHEQLLSKPEESIECTNCAYLDTERKMVIMILENIRKILDLSEYQHKAQDETYSIIEHLSTIETCLKNLLINIHKKVETLNRSKNEKSNYIQNITEKDTLISVWNTLVTTLERKEEENISTFSEQDKTYGLKIQDLQSQLVENNEIQSLYQTKCLEYNDLEEQLLQLQNKNIEEKRENELIAHSRVQEELEVLRTELERNSHSYLNKNKECDTLKLELLQLEETIYQFKLEVGTLRGYEKTAQLASALQSTIRHKDEEINKLKSILEDKELMLGSSKREKQFLDELLKEKEHLDKEKEELLFQNEQNDRLVHEKEILLRHKEVTLKELEAKTNRELERLRNHMMMTEESHTKDILELQEREEALQQELEDVRQGLSKKSIILQDSSKQFQDHCIDLEEQLHSLSTQRDSSLLELSKCQDKIAEDGMAIYNLQNALEQLQKEKLQQSDYLASFTKRKEIEYERRIEELTEELNKTQDAMSEASLAVQGINKLNLELQQKENELKVSKEKAKELLARLKQMELERDKILEAVDQKLDKPLLRNLFMKYFQSDDGKRADILKVIGGLLGWSAVEIQQLGSGAAPSKLGGWITNVWAYGSPKKTPMKTVSRNPTPVGTPTFDTNKSFSELFVKFLENETTTNTPVDTTSLTLSNDVSPSVHMFVSPTTPDILTSHNNSHDQRIPAPGQEIPRVHTHHAQSTLKAILTTTPY